MENQIYTKSELKESERFKNRIDAVEALLDEDVLYSIDEAEGIIDMFMKGSV